MNITKKNIRKYISLGITLLIMPILTKAAGIDDIQNYKAPPQKTLKIAVPTYTMEDVIEALTNKLDDNGIYPDNQSIFDPNYDPKAQVFDEQKFGKCEYFYTRYTGYNGGTVFLETMHYLFPKDEQAKENASSIIKKTMQELEHPENSETGVRGYGDTECVNWHHNVDQLKEILNTIIQAAPSILQEKQRRVTAKQMDVVEKQRQAQKIAANKERARKQARSERQVKENTAMKEREAQQNATQSCQTSKAYKLFIISGTIVAANRIAEDAKQVIRIQQDGAEISGYLDTQVIHDSGLLIAAASKDNQANFPLYRELGGTAMQIESVSVLPNPCM